MKANSEELLEAVKANIEYIESGTVEDFISFLEAIGETLYDGELIESLAQTVRDVIDGIE